MAVTIIKRVKEVLESGFSSLYWSDYFDKKTHKDPQRTQKVKVTTEQGVFVGIICGVRGTGTVDIRLPTGVVMECICCDKNLVEILAVVTIVMECP